MKNRGSGDEIREHIKNVGIGATRLGAAPISGAQYDTQSHPSGVVGNTPPLAAAG
jgi:hypothetical protein